jgi:hypothetical protein
MITTATAVASLRPGAEWSMNGDDVENIIWHTEGVEPLTQAEVDAEIARLEKEAEDKAASEEALRQSAMQKLAALGLTEEEVKVVING